jgi:protocatechuate 3,4-dioxygenase, beta subunit
MWTFINLKGETTNSFSPKLSMQVLFCYSYINQFTKIIMYRLKLILLSTILFAVNNTQADIDDEMHLNKLNVCQVTTVAMNDYEPENFEKSNNLLRKAGEESLFCGESIIVYGRVVDQNCVPVSDAKIYTWQTDCKGIYPYKPLKENIVDAKLVNDQTNLTFTGNGTATTNNKGEFHFITVYPPEIHGHGPHLNVRVEHFSMGNLQTRLTLKGKKVKNPSDDAELNSISKVAFENGISIYKFEIVIPGSTNKEF